MLPPDFIIAIISCKTASYAILPQFRAFVNTGAYRIRSGNDRDADSRAAGRSISIHAPRRGSDGTLPGLNEYINAISIHAPRRGSDVSIRNAKQPLIVFQSTLPAGGATVRTLSYVTIGVISIHAPRRGSDTFKLSFVRLPNISIHAPRRGSDQNDTGRILPHSVFQSTLPAGGATNLCFKFFLLFVISIHAPRRGSD